MNVCTLPKVELHRHLDGSIRKPANLKALLQKSTLHQQIFASADNIRRVTAENIEDLEEDGVVLGELRFAPAFMRAGHDVPYADIAFAVFDGVAEGRWNSPKVEAGLIFIAVRDMPVDESMRALNETLRCAQSHPYGAKLVGFDLAGAEDGTDPVEYRPLVQRARDAGLQVTVHSGEDTGPAVMAYTIDVLQPDRIGHGVRAAEDPDLVRRLVATQLHLELCVTSNYLTKVVEHVKDHPIGMFLREGVNFSINSDDPHLMGIDLVHEYQCLVDTFQFTEADFAAINARALAASFMPESAKLLAQKRIDFARQPTHSQRAYVQARHISPSVF